MKLDPVCGMEVDPKSAAGSTVYEDETYFFCSMGCKATFDKDPEKFLSANDAHGAHGHHDHH